MTADTALNQSLARGAAAEALVHIERARSGTGTWDTVRTCLRHVTTGPIDASDQAGLYYGAPAIAFLLHTAATHHPGFRAAAEKLNDPVIKLTQRRLAAAHARIDRGDPATFTEYDLFYGLTGIGTLLLHYPIDERLLADVLHYVVRLIQPRHRGGGEVPGWWVNHDPDQIIPTPGGHANFGMAHGAAGLLAFLALATIHGHEVHGQHEAIHVLLNWFDGWQQDDTRWPQWITRGELRAGCPNHAEPARPYWCYGNVGIARALQLAAIAIADSHRQQAAESILLDSLADANLARLTDPGLCHGIAGVYQTALRAARDARTPLLAEQLARVRTLLAAHPGTAPGGLLTGGPGITLAQLTTQHPTPGWDTCLLIT
ncbi:hypothetical protein JOD54_006209 [Actinokineospora baliensis]|uniref:lanthionine synthetase C family protein n=1 Tax=Actinokineospora baliensis TaxID=547056 RepID=UPI00195C1988|nr:lanthionine synthetase C family protein [Actinokineospora baliensis]MBM7776005.1 hypothetical protein [Actinokineospora baliensis]